MSFLGKALENEDEEIKRRSVKIIEAIKANERAKIIKKYTDERFPNSKIEIDEIKKHNT